MAAGLFKTRLILKLGMSITNGTLRLDLISSEEKKSKLQIHGASSLTDDEGSDSELS